MNFKKKQKIAKDIEDVNDKALYPRLADYTFKYK